MDKTQRELKQLGDQVAEMMDKLRELGGVVGDEVTESVEDYAHDVKAKAKWAKAKAAQTAKDVDTYAHNNPWQIAAGGLIAGLALGILLSRQK